MSKKTPKFLLKINKIKSKINKKELLVSTKKYLKLLILITIFIIAIIIFKN